MKLYYGGVSPFARKVRVALIETGLTDQVEQLPVVANPLTDIGPPASANPLKKIPCLLRDDGKPLYDSRVICRYIDTLALQTGLYPGAPRLWDALTLEATADGMMDAAILVAYEVLLRPEERRFPAWVDGQWSKVAAALDALEQSWMAYLDGTPDMAHFAVACALDYIDFRHDARRWRDGHPKLADWAAKFAERPSLQATTPKE
jgi:glutathione S-transferase